MLSSLLGHPSKSAAQPSSWSSPPLGHPQPSTHISMQLSGSSGWAQVGAHGLLHSSHTCDPLHCCSSTATSSGIVSWIRGQKARRGARDEASRLSLGCCERQPSFGMCGVWWVQIGRTIGSYQVSPLGNLQSTPECTWHWIHTKQTRHLVCTHSHPYNLPP